jgi:hypothetical protein
MADMSPEDRELLKKLLANPLMFPDKFKSWLADYIGTNVPKMPIRHVYGFQVETVRVAPTIVTAQACTSTSYGDLATVGPSLTGLANGLYLVVYGATANGAIDSRQGVSINGAAVNTDEELTHSFFFGGGALATSFMTRMTSDHNNSLVTKYRIDSAGSVNFEKRWLVAFKAVAE